jgi:endonuclease/exonuclease/phosphatase family metal-dependent hydrolase
MFLPRSAQAAPAAAELHLMTYNLKSQASDLDSALNIIRQSGADIVAVQELSAAMGAAMQTALADLYPYQALHTIPGEGIPGQGVLSRFPLLADDYWRIHIAHQRVEVDFAGERITLYNTHPIQPLRPGGFDMRGEEIADLLDRTSSESGPLLLMGDFNMSDQSDDYRQITERYQDTYRAAGWGLGLTFPAEMPLLGNTPLRLLLGAVPPLVRLDYVFHNESFESLEAYVGSDSGGSDHLPVYATLGLKIG